MWGLALYFVPAITALFTHFGMTVEKGIRIYPLYAVAICGTIATLFCSSALAKTRIASILSYIGSKTLYILIFHFLAFKPITWILVRYYGNPVSDMAEVAAYIIQPNSWWWMVYTLSGVCISLLAWEFFHLPCWQKIKIKRN
jgi:fucose 4-O-acetylase-like acetyltransferase